MVARAHYRQLVFAFMETATKAPWDEVISTCLVSAEITRSEHSFLVGLTRVSQISAKQRETLFRIAGRVLSYRNLPTTSQLT